MEEKSKTRFSYISFIRFFALISIMFAHFTENAFFTNELLKPLNTFVYYYSSFGVFAFFFISGFLYIRTKGDTIIFWRKKAISVIIPFLIASLLIFLLKVIRSCELNPLDFAGLFLGYGNYLWFVPVLLIIFVIYKISDSVVFDYLMISISLISITLTSINAFGITSVLENTSLGYFIITQYFLAFSLGRIFRRYGLYEKMNSVTAILLSITSLAAIALIIIFPIIKTIAYWKYPSHILALIFVSFLLCISKFIKCMFFDVYCAPYIYSIYLYHMLPLQFVLSRIPNYFAIIFTLAFALISCVILHFISKKIGRVAFVHNLLLLIGIRS